MIVYILPVILCYIIGISKQRKLLKVELLFLIYLVIFLCFGFMCGSDWRSYETIYTSIDLNNYGWGYYAEPGFYAYLAFFKLLGVDFWNLNVFTKVVSFIVCLKTLKEYLSDRLLLGLMYFIPWYGIYLYIDCPMRNMMAMSIFLLAVPYLKSRSFLKYSILMVIAASFHFSAIIYIFLYFFVNRRISSKVFVILYIIVNLIFVSRSLTIGIISLLFGGIPYVEGKLESYIINESVFASGRIFSLGMLLHFAYFLIILCKRRTLEKYDNGNFIINMAILYLLLYRVAGTIEIFMRFLLFLSPFFCVALIRCTCAFSMASRRVYLLMLLMVAFIGLQRIFADYRYIPYTSYLPYLIEGNYPSYEYRTMYNYIHSPYAK